MRNIDAYSTHKHGSLISQSGRAYFTSCVNFRCITWHMITETSKRHMVTEFSKPQSIYYGTFRCVTWHVIMRSIPHWRSTPESTFLKLLASMLCVSIFVKGSGLWPLCYVHALSLCAACECSLSVVSAAKVLWAKRVSACCVYVRAGCERVLWVRAMSAASECRVYLGFKWSRQLATWPSPGLGFRLQLTELAHDLRGWMGKGTRWGQWPWHGLVPVWRRAWSQALYFLRLQLPHDLRAPEMGRGKRWGQWPWHGLVPMWRCAWTQA
jgi:hypothetical protein